uniref:hypothetical protein n=1 Tax=Clostridium paraputrificum TaxID=29363 RepID=UPI003BAB8923
MRKFTINGVPIKKHRTIVIVILFLLFLGVVNFLPMIPMITKGSSEYEKTKQIETSYSLLIDKIENIYDLIFNKGS